MKWLASTLRLSILTAPLFGWLATLKMEHCAEQIGLQECRHSMETSMTTPTTFTAILADWEARQPDAVAITFAGTHRTWAELAHRVRRLAAALRAAGLQPGDRVAVLDLNHPSCLELTLACAQVGTADAVVNFRLAPPEIAYVINDAKARLLFVGPEFAARSRSCVAICPLLSA